MFNKMKLGTKITFSLAITATLMLLVGLVGITNIRKINTADTYMYEKCTRPLVIIGGIATDFQHNQVLIYQSIIEPNPDLKTKYSNAIIEANKEIQKRFEDYSTAYRDDNDKKNFEQLMALYKNFAESNKKVIEFALAGQPDEAILDMTDTKYTKTKDELNKVLHDIMQQSESSAKQTADQNTRIANIATTFMISIILFAVILSGVIGYFILRNYADIIKHFLAEMAKLIDATINGRLSVRADTARINFEFRAIAEGMNETLDAVTGPLNVAADYINRIAVGEIPEKITEESKGDFNEIKNNLNLLIESQNLVTQAASAISEGDLSIDLAARSSSDQLIPAIIKMTSSLHNIIADVNIIAAAAVAGELSIRADALKHKGEYKKVIDGLNSVMTAIADPLSETARVLQAAAGRDLSQRVAGSYKGQIEELKININATIDSLDKALSEVAEIVGHVNSGAEQISDASQSLSQGSTEQASSLEEITSSMAEIGSQTKINAENANQANILSKTVRNSAENGQGKMLEMVSAMGNISESSNKISKIIKVIDEIAFQTNLLALNAAVEAARAGRHGKGFAVVADEVRNLAGRSAKAAKETAELIESSLDKVSAGTGIAEVTSASFIEILGGIVKVTDIVGEIAAASSEQAQGVIQINQGLSQIDKVTQQNTANAEETASAAEELSSQSLILQKLTDEFHLTGNRGKRERSETQTRPTEKPVIPKKQMPAKGWGTGNNKPLISLDDNDFGKF